MKRGPVIFLFGIVGFFVSTSANIVSAQSTVMFENFLPTITDTNQRNRILWEPFNSEDRGKIDEQSSEDFKSLTFSPTLLRRKSNIDRFISKVRAVDPVSANQLQQIFSTTDLIEGIGQSLSYFGLRTDNVADAYTVYWMSAWQASVGRTGDFEPNVVAKVQAQAQLALRNTPEILNATDADKQEFAEALLIQTALIEAAMEQAAGNPEQLSAIATSVRQGGKAAGLDLDTMTLTEEGFVPVQKGG